MEQYWVEGLFANAAGVRKARKSGVYPPSAIEPYAKGLWANSPDEALHLATETLKGGEWLENPVVSRLTEEQRMRAIGAPEFPGLEAPARKKRGRP
jgi:hypothetical protein